MFKDDKVSPTFYKNFVPQMDVDIAGSKEAEYVCDSNDALEFKLVRSAENLEDDSVSFKPKMSHQIFGDSESIFGYKDLTVKLYYSACRLTMYLGLEYKAAVDPKQYGGVEPDNVLKIVQEKLQIQNILANIDEFTKALKDDESFQPFGEKLTSFNVEQDNGNKNYEIYYCDINNKKFLNFHERLQTFILFYIDAASYIDVDDPKWQFFVIYEKYRSQSGSTCYAVAGYSTVYEYYAYPDRVRPRISQMLVLPPFQRQGLGAHLLSSIYCHYRGQDSVADITVKLSKVISVMCRRTQGRSSGSALLEKTISDSHSLLKNKPLLKLSKVISVMCRRTQGRSSGSALLEKTISDSHSLLKNKPLLEDPNEEFQYLRDYVDACLCSSLPNFSREKLLQGFNPAMATEACSKFKINKKQARRVYEILRLKETNVHNDEEYSSFRLDVKRRLNILFQKEAILMKKLKPLLDEDPQLHTALGLKTSEQRFEILEKLFSDTEKDYKKTLLRIEERPLPSNLF